MKKLTDEEKSEGSTLGEKLGGKKCLVVSPSTHQLLAQMIPSLFCDAQRSLPVIILHVCHCARPQQESHGLWLVLYDAVMERCVPLLCPPVEAARVLDEEVDDVQRPARFL